MKKSIKIAFNLCAIALLAFVVTATTGLNPFYSGAGVLASTFLRTGQTGVAYTNLQQEIWTDIIVEQFRTTEDAGFLNEIPDESRWVVSSKGENETIHLNDIGADPEVLINNTTYPIGYSTQTDADIPINLHKFQTKATKVSDDELKYISYDKVAIVTAKHEKSVMNTKHSLAVHALAPAGDTVNTPVIVTTGGDDGTGRKKMLMKDLLALKRKMDKLKIPLAGRVLVLCSDHYNDLLEEADGKPIFTGGAVASSISGLLSNSLQGFKVYTYIDAPYFTPSTKVKLAFGAVPDEDDQQASVAFYAPDMFKANGSTKFYTDPANTQTQEQAFNLRHYSITLPRKQRAIAAIVSNNV